MKHILIVDDAATVRLYYRNILETAGYSVQEAVNGIEALEKALQRTFDLYIVDLNMPKLDGYGFVKDLRGRDLPQAPVVMVSTEAALNDRRQAYSLGVNLYLIKPVKPDVLIRFCHLLLGEALP
jgi:two-component system, chemotaxis family, chemotaxis protein CheY